MANESLFSELDRKAKEASERQRLKKQAQINEKAERAKKGQTLL